VRAKTLDTNCPIQLAPPGPHESASGARLGLVLGAGAVALWSFGSSLVFLGAREMGTWPFVALASLTGGLLQLGSRRIHPGELRSSLCLPWRLWVVPILCFVVYGLVWPLALALSTPKQVFGVSLINYLWPILTVLFSVACVPGVRLTRRTIIALALALTGLVCANLGSLRDLASAQNLRNPAAITRYLPYLLAFVAAVTWGLYSTFLVRWRRWARGYVTSPIGFLLIGLVAAALALWPGHPPATPTPAAAWLTLLYGAGPLAGGYLLWELALPRARVQTLSLVAATTPVLSTSLLCLFLKTLPGPELIAAALLISFGVALSMKD
jgi:drug/metabolite transporter (DMT)-like permease